jgi:hypothetical protein
MQALSDEQQMDRLEKTVDRLETKMDGGFAAVRTELRAETEGVRNESRADFRTLVGVLLAMYVTMIFGFAGILAAILLQHA